MRRFAAFLVAILLVVAAVRGGRPAVSPAETVLQGKGSAAEAPAEPLAVATGPHGRVAEVEVWEFRNPGEVEHHLSAGSHELVVATDTVRLSFTVTDCKRPAPVPC